MVFNHSVKVPTQYKKAAAVLKTALERKKSLKSLIFEEKHARTGALQALLKKYIAYRPAIEKAIEQTKILEENPRLCVNLCRVLVTELFFGRLQLNGESRPVITVREYKDRLQQALLAEGVDATTLNLHGQKNTVSTVTNSKPRYVLINRNLASVDLILQMLADDNWRRKEINAENYADYVNAIKSLEEDEFLIDMHVEGLLVFHPKHKSYWAQEYKNNKRMLLQDKATCLVAELLQPPAGAVVLDMCAAPGMKTIHTCNVMQNKGTIYAVEQDVERYRLLCELTKEAGCDIVKPIKADALTTDGSQFPGVQYILVDPSCSGSGMQNRMSLEDDDKNPERLRKLAGLQIKMLSHAMSAFPDVKRIVYSTCSLYEEENEQVVQRCLELNPNFKLLNGKKALRNKWQNVGNTEYKKIGKNCLYSRPDYDLTDGIFIALFEKLEDEK